MLYGVPLFAGRVAPRCTIAETMLLVRVINQEIISKKEIKLDENIKLDLAKFLEDNKVETLVCGGISSIERENTIALGINVFDNVACNVEELIDAIINKKLRRGYGLDDSPQEKVIEPLNSIPTSEHNASSGMDCLMCTDRQCLEGNKCPQLNGFDNSYSNSQEEIIDAATDIVLEDERKLCRLSELIYFALEMNYKRIGIAYCVDLTSQTEILTRVLRRFFDVYPVCCKIGGHIVEDHEKKGSEEVVACNPVAQARVLNNIGVDLNVIVGLCIGADCIFTKASQADVTTLFVKDKSLANNPIGALYSDYYLKEVTL